MNTTTKHKTVSANQNRGCKYSTWIKGSALTELGWKEGQILAVLEGFVTKRAAAAAGRAALISLKTETTAPASYKVGPAY